MTASLSSSAAGRVAIIGAGMAGLACAHVLTGRGSEVHLYDKGRGPGGRMSTRRVAIGDIEVGFDHGAQYFTARDKAFLAQVRTWQSAGLVAPWPAAGADAWVGTPAMNAPVAAMAARLSVRFGSRIERVTRFGTGWRLHGDADRADIYDTVVVAVPAEQVPALIIDDCPGFAAIAEATPSAPCWTVMAAFSDRVTSDDDIVKAGGDIVWAARNSAKPGRAAMETWVIQASPDWSRRHWETPPADVCAAMMQALGQRIGAVLPDTRFVQAHSWLYARSGSNGYGYLFDRTIRLGVCGDWLAGPRVECAWLSGNALGKAAAQT